MIPLSCPLCGYDGDILAFVSAEDYERAIQAALKLPSTLEPLVWRYLYLFRPPKNRIQADRLARLLEYLAEQISQAEVTRGGIVWAAPLELWHIALRIVLDTPPSELPLKNHNYLLQVVANLASRAAAKVERNAEQLARQPERHFFQAGQPLPQPEAPAVAPAPTLRTHFRPPADWLQTTLQKIAQGEQDEKEQD